MKNWKIQHRFLLMGMLPGLLLSIVLGGYFIHQRYQDMYSLLDQRALAMAKQLAPVCEYGVTIGNTAILQNIANNMLEEPDVRSVSIYNHDMDLLAHSGPRMMTDQMTGSQIQRGQMHLMHTSGSVRIRSPIVAQNLEISDQVSNQFFAEQESSPRLLGWAELELSATNTQLNWYQHLASSLGLIVASLLICLIIAIYISRQFSRPSGNIVNALKAMCDEKFDTRVRVESGGELGEMASTLNVLASNLQRSKAEQQRSLDEATRDMQETMDDLEIRNRQLMLDQRDAQEASRMKSEFLANISHEIRTPLTSIIGYVNLMSRTRLSHQQQSYLATMGKSSKALMKIISDLLDLSKLEAGKLIIEHAPLNLRDVVEDVLIAMAPTGLEKNLDLVLDIGEDVPCCVLGDELRLTQVLTNLLGNAVKFTEHGAVTARLRLINIRDNRANILFEIQDTGIGLTTEQRQKLFNAFTQADNSTTRKFGGSGLGLIISRALVQEMHGDIQVESTPNEGSTFSFHISLDIDKSNQKALASLGSGNIAVLDDRDHSRDNLHRLLSEWDLRSINCTSANELEELLHEQPMQVDAVIMAVKSDFIGTPTCQSLVNRLVPQGVPIITLVDSTREKDQQAMLSYGAKLCLSRPLGSRKLHDTLDRLLNGNNAASIKQQQRPELLKNNVVSPPRILVVDDNEANLYLAITLLKDLGLPTMAASSGSQAIDIVTNNNIDLVFMDIQMPEMNGVEATNVIRQIPGKQTIPVIALTAHAMADERRALLSNGMNGYQTKPISIEELIESIYQFTGFRAENSMAADDLVVEPEEFYETGAFHEQTAFAEESGFDANKAEAQVFSSEPEAVDETVTDETAVFSKEQALKAASGKPALAQEMMRMLLASLEKETGHFIELWEQENLEELQAAIHKMHGATRYCGVPALQQALREMETALKQQQSAELPVLLRNVMEASQQLQTWSADNDWQQLLTA